MVVLVSRVGWVRGLRGSEFVYTLALASTLETLRTSLGQKP